MGALVGGQVHGPSKFTRFKTNWEPLAHITQQYTQEKGSTKK